MEDPTIINESYCTICKIQLANIYSYRNHLTSQKHNKNAKNDSGITDTLYCRFCNSYYSNRLTFSNHLTSKKHIKNSAIEEKIDKSKCVFYCEKCDFGSDLTNAFNRHIETDKHKLTKEEYKIFKQTMMLENMELGYKHEMFILNLLQKCKFDDIIYIGNTGNMFDILVKCPDEKHYRGIQVKSLHRTSDISYTFILGHKYYDDTLIIGVNIIDNIFSLFFSKNMRTKASISFSKMNKDYLYITDIEVFTNLLIQSISKSTIVENINDFLNKTQKIEAESIERFSKICEGKGIILKRSNSYIDVVDATINGYKVQFKSSSTKANNLYSFGLARHVNGKLIPYTVNDNIDFFIFEIIQIDYIGKFYIIPVNVLVKGQFISIDDNIGKCRVHMAPFDYNKSHWTLKFIDMYDFFIHTAIIDNKLINFTNSYLYQYCNEKNINFEVDRENNIISINKHKIRHIKGGTVGDVSFTFDMRIQVDKKRRNLHVDDAFEFIIGEINYRNYQYLWILPIAILLERRYIKTEKMPGKCCLAVRYPNAPINWTSEFINRFDLLA